MGPSTPKIHTIKHLPTALNSISTDSSEDSPLSFYQPTANEHGVTKIVDVLKRVPYAFAAIQAHQQKIDQARIEIIEELEKILNIPGIDGSDICAKANLITSKITRPETLAPYVEALATLKYMEHALLDQLATRPLFLSTDTKHTSTNPVASSSSQFLPAPHMPRPNRQTHRMIQPQYATTDHKQRCQNHKYP
ncbi:MAG: hypothetical protein H7240_08620 [Glaciimonas sp.]|nr:hypothetical protein [Glaciimonas sp.]